MTLLCKSTDNKTHSKNIIQLDVDICQTNTEIIIYAQAHGLDVKDVNVYIEGNADTVVIEGVRRRPEILEITNLKSGGDFFTEECLWGDFYRCVILPQPINIEHASAEINHGVLILKLPLLKSKETLKPHTSKVKKRNKI